MLQPSCLCQSQMHMMSVLQLVRKILKCFLFPKRLKTTVLAIAQYRIFRFAKPVILFSSCCELFPHHILFRTLRMKQLYFGQMKFRMGFIGPTRTQKSPRDVSIFLPFSAAGRWTGPPIMTSHQRWYQSWQRPLLGQLGVVIELCQRKLS